MQSEHPNRSQYKKTGHSGDVVYCTVISVVDDEIFLCLGFRRINSCHEINSSLFENLYCLTITSTVNKRIGL